MMLSLIAKLHSKLFHDISVIVQCTREHISDGSVSLNTNDI